jgi:hypothetical protein
MLSASAQKSTVRDSSQALWFRTSSQLIYHNWPISESSTLIYLAVHALERRPQSQAKITVLGLDLAFRCQGTAPGIRDIVQPLTGRDVTRRREGHGCGAWHTKGAVHDQHLLFM